MSGHPQRHEELYVFLQRVRERSFVSVRDLSGEEIQMAEELVKLKLLSKISTRFTTVYSYGATMSGDGGAKCIS